MAKRSNKTTKAKKVMGKKKMKKLRGGILDEQGGEFSGGSLPPRRPRYTGLE